MTGTIYRKKKNTVEFTPGQKIQKGPAAAACAAAQRGACGRAHRDAPRADVHRLHDADRRAGRRPRGQHAGLYGRLQRRAPAAPPGPRAGAARCARADDPAADAYDESTAVDESSWAKHDGHRPVARAPPVGRRGHAGQHADREHPPDADGPGAFRLYPKQCLRDGPVRPAHSGFTQRIDMPAAPAPAVRPTRAVRPPHRPTPALPKGWTRPRRSPPTAATPRT